jgi:hypothetical protein
MTSCCGTYTPVNKLTVDYWCSYQADMIVIRLPRRTHWKWHRDDHAQRWRVNYNTDVKDALKRIQGRYRVHRVEVPIDPPIQGAGRNKWASKKSTRMEIDIEFNDYRIARYFVIRCL